MRKIYILVILYILSAPGARAQESNFHYSVETSAGYISDSLIPFWLRSNQFGSIPLDRASLSFVGRAGREYDINNKKLFDWGVSLEGRANIGKKSEFLLIEGYGKIRVSIFEIRAGRSKEIMGLCDTALSSGAFSVSGNALGIPKIQISIPEFYTIPVFRGLFAFKGNYAHGWLGDLPVNMLDGSVDTLKTFLHQLSFYGRFGKPGWKLKLYGGINHQVQWGSESVYYGSNYTLSDMQRYWYVISGKAYGTSRIPTSKIGNHLGSIDAGLEYNFTNVRLFAYHQFFYDVGALYYLANIRDGLSGISLTNRRTTTDQIFRWNKILMEFFYSKNQAGEFWSPYTPSGDENYYNNDTYIDGWSYKGVGVGNPFVGNRYGIREELPNAPGDYFINNRVVALHLGFEGSVQNWGFILKASYSRNFGTFGTSEAGHSLGSIHYPPKFGIFTETKQISSYFEANRALERNFKFGLAGAFDIGDLYYNSFGLQVKLSKSF
ncbi:MAG: capsule assembly Wzi family protein [Bacteroidales bacterium]|nr:capsule assembly Wzi family protein [Bacteroidales bacterium]